MEVLEVQPIFMRSTHAQDAITICTLCDTTFPSASTNANICLKCITNQSDITSGIIKQAVLNYCSTCQRFLGPPWTHVQPESKELLALCLRRIRGLNKVKIIDASFIWTEPQSQRIKVKLTIQKEVMKNVSVQRTFPVEYVIHSQQCEDCKKEYISESWGALVQVKQRADQKKSVLFLEQLILKYNAHDKVMKMKDMNEGVDFYYKEKGDAMRLVEFLQSMYCVRVKQSKQLASQDEENATSNYKYVYSVDLPKVCKDDLVIMTPTLAAAMGGCSSVLLCSKVGTTIQLTDPTTMETVELSSLQYFQYEEEMAFVSAKENLAEFIVVETETCGSLNNNINNRVKLSKIQLVRKRDYKEFEVKTYLSDTLKEGNSVLGYDLPMLDCRGYFNNIVAPNALPEILIVKKCYLDAISGKRRIWRLKQLNKEQNDTKTIYVDEEQQAKDYEEFLNELETDPEMRLHINLYRDEKAIKQNRNKMDDENGETSRQNRKKQIKRKLKVKRGSKGSPLAAVGGQDREDRDHEDDDDMQEERRDDESDDKEKEEEEEEEEDPMVKIGELLADLTLEDEIEEEENDVIEEFIRRLERVRIEGKE